METLGQVLKATRERKRISLSQAAAKTRIKIQHLEMMERDDFSQMPAPAYARGFIRMYADFLGLDAGPLVEEYNARHLSRGPAKPAAASRRAPEPSLPAASEEPTAPSRSRVPWSVYATRALRLGLNALSPANLKRAGWALAIVLALVFVTTGLKRCASHRVEQASSHAAGSTHFPKGAPSVLQEPPEPYLPVPTTGER